MNIINDQEYNAMKNHESNKNSAFQMDKDFDLSENKQIKKKKHLSNIPLCQLILLRLGKMN